MNFNNKTEFMPSPVALLMAIASADHARLHSLPRPVLQALKPIRAMRS